MLTLVFSGALLSFCVGFPLRKILLSKELLDQPNERSSHSTTALRGGGWTMLITVLVIATFADEIRSGGQQVAIFLATVVLFSLVGFVDDWRSLPAAFRLLCQLALGFSFAYLGLGSSVLVIVGAGIFLAAVTNGVNFMDGIDGISAVQMLTVGITFAVLFHGRLGWAAMISGLAASAAVGYAPHNFMTPKLFLGDIGSYLIGACCGLLTLIGWANGLHPIGVTLPLWLYGADTCSTVVRRRLKGRPFSEAHREHVYQRLAVKVKSHRRALAIFAAAQCALCGSGIAIDKRPDYLVLWLIVGAIATVGFLGSVRVVNSKTF